MDKYQVMPELTELEYQELKDSIAQHGVQVAVEYDEDGNVLDGHHRLQACKELGISVWPKIVKVGMDENQKMDYALMVNATRRQLSREQKQELIWQQLKRTPEKSDRQIAELVGVDNSTVSRNRQKMEETGQLLQCNSSIGADGKVRPRQTKSPMYPETESCANRTTQYKDSISEIPKCETVITSDGRQYPRQIERKPLLASDVNSEHLSKAKDLIEAAASEFVNAAAERKLPLREAAGQVAVITEGLDKARDERLERSGEVSYDEKYGHYFEDDDEDRREILINNTHKAFYTICEKVSYLRNDYSNIAWCLLAAGNSKADLIDDVSRCIEGLQNIKVALCKKDTKFLQVVK